MTQTYTQRKKAVAAPERAAGETKGPSVSRLAAGAQPTQEQMGSRVDLPGGDKGKDGKLLRGGFFEREII